MTGFKSRKLDFSPHHPALSLLDAGRGNKKLLKDSFSKETCYLLGLIIKWVSGNNSKYNDNSNNHHLLSLYYVPGVVEVDGMYRVIQSCSLLFCSAFKQQDAPPRFPSSCPKYLKQSHTPKPPTNSQRHSKA